MSLFESFRRDWETCFQFVVDNTLGSLRLLRSNSWWHWLSGHAYWSLLGSSISWSSNLNSSTKQCPPMHLTILRLIASSVWVHIKSLHKLTIHGPTDRGLRVSISVSMERRFPEISRQARVRQPSRSELKLLELLSQFLFLFIA